MQLSTSTTFAILAFFTLAQAQEIESALKSLASAIPTSEIVAFGTSVASALATGATGIIVDLESKGSDFASDVQSAAASVTSKIDVTALKSAAASVTSKVDATALKSAAASVTSEAAAKATGEDQEGGAVKGTVAYGAAALGAMGLVLVL